MLYIVLGNFSFIPSSVWFSNHIPQTTNKLEIKTQIDKQLSNNPHCGDQHKIWLLKGTKPHIRHPKPKITNFQNHIVQQTSKTSKTKYNKIPKDIKTKLST